jgi:microcystin-dependent protein
MFAGNFAPANWAFCGGSLIAISDNPTLFNLLGTTYGGNGTTTFALPDLRGRSPVHQGSGNPIGLSSGAENVTLTVSQLPVHTHIVQASTGTNGTPVNTPTGNFWSAWTGGQYSTENPTLALAPTAVNSAGSSLPHDNMAPFLAVNFIISLFGIYPSQG